MFTGTALKISIVNKTAGKYIACETGFGEYFLASRNALPCFLLPLSGNLKSSGDLKPAVFNPNVWVQDFAAQAWEISSSCR
jgi:hypothetical protein